MVSALPFKNDFEREAFHTSSLVLSSEEAKPRREVILRSVDKLMLQGRVMLVETP